MKRQQTLSNFANLSNKVLGDIIQGMQKDLLKAELNGGATETMRCIAGQAQYEVQTRLQSYGYSERRAFDLTA